MKAQDPSMLYKLMVLYMLKVMQAPLTNSEICEFILDKGYTDTFNIQIVITDLLNDKLINAEKMHNRTYYTLLQEGKDVLESLESRIAPAIKNEIYSYLSAKEYEIKNDHSIQTKVSKKSDDEYEALLTAYDKKGEILSIKMTFPTESLAMSVCDKFNDENNDIYKYLISKLLK